MEQQTFVKTADVVKLVVDRGVALESSAGEVYNHLGEFIRTAVQRGQNIEVPHFGVFGSRLAGTKKIRRLPYFEANDRLAYNANERFAVLKSIVVGSFKPVAAVPRREYTGTVLRDLPDQNFGGNIAIDAGTTVTLDEYRKELRNVRESQHQQEVILMPKLNLRDDGLESDLNPLEPEKVPPPPPTLRDVGGGGGRSSPLLLIIIIIVALAGGVFLLNQFKVINLWGKKTPKVAETIPEPGLPGEEGTTIEQEPGTEPAPAEGELPMPTPTPTTEATPVPAEPTPELKPAPEEKARPALPPSGGGNFTVQVSAWTSKSKADEEVGKLSSAGMDAFVENAQVDGIDWYRVRVGRYGSEQEAKTAAEQLQKMMEGVVWVARAK